MFHEKVVTCTVINTKGFTPQQSSEPIRHLHIMRTSRFILAVAFLFGIMMQSYAQSNIHKIWIMSTQTPGLEMLFDLTDNTKMIQAHRYTQKALDKMGLKRIEPGVWYIKDIKKYQVNAYDENSGEIRCETPCGDYDPEFSFSSLTSNNVELSFGNAFMLEAKAVSQVSYAERELLDINVSDMMDIFTYWCDNTMQRFMADKEGRRLVSKKEEAEDDRWSWEAWGRDLEYQSLSWVKKGSNALGLNVKTTDWQEVELVFADKSMIPVLETQMARMGFLKQTTRNAEGMTETVYAPKGWKNHSGEYYFVLSMDQNWTEEYGLCYLFYTLDY